MLSKLKWLVIETWPTNSWWCMGSPAGGFNSIFYFYIEMMFHLTCSSIFSGFPIQGFIVQTIMFFHDEVSSIGFKDKNLQRNVTKTQVCDWSIAIILEDLGAFYFSWFGQIIPHNLTPVSEKDHLIFNGNPGWWWNIWILAQKLVVHPSWSVFFVFFFMDFLVKCHTETHMEVFF